ncbi:AAA family ATPase [Candidatus Woesearchaeota archaeon]|nr:AAA family ATPase [Candidatus Woesearchaeota archaeon]
MKASDPMKKIVGLDSPTYVNTTRVARLGKVDFYLWDVLKVAASAGLNVGLYGGAGMGKSQAFADLKSLVGNRAAYVLGRNDLDIKSLYRQLDFGKLVQAMKEGGVVSQQELSRVTSMLYAPLIIVEEINRAAEIVQNQLFNIYEGFIEIDGKKYHLGGTHERELVGLDGQKRKEKFNFCIGVWSANFGNGAYTGTVSMDKALKDRSHLIIDVDNFSPGSENPSDLDAILLGSGGEVKLKDQREPEDHTEEFVDAFAYLKQMAKTPDPKELGEELLMFRYLVQGLDYIPCDAAGNSKRKMKEVWPSKAEEDNIGADDEVLLYRMVYPSSIRGAQAIINLSRALRAYARAKDPKSHPTVLESIVESFKLVASYSGLIENPQRLVEKYVGNPYRASCDAAKVIKARLDGKKDLIQAINYFKGEGKPLPKSVLDECTGEFACWK